MKKTGVRIPTKFFITKGSGQSNYGSGAGDPHEAGSYDAALCEAGIENYNIVKYTSVMPTNVKEITKNNGLKKLEWGCVLESIMAQMNTSKGNRGTAAVLLSQVYDKKGKHLGGFACEYMGVHGLDYAKTLLLNDVKEMMERRNYGNKWKIIKDKKVSKKFKLKDKTCMDPYVSEKGFILHPSHFIGESIVPTKSYGTALASVSFVEFKWLK